MNMPVNRAEFPEEYQGVSIKLYDYIISFDFKIFMLKS